MELFALYVRYLSEICEGTRPAPGGVTVPADGDAEQKVLAVQQAAFGMGIPAFVRLCAEKTGEEVPQEWYDGFDLHAVLQTMQQAQPEESVKEDDSLPKIEEPDGPRDAYEVLLDCCLLEDNLFSYLMELLKTNDGLGFFRLAQVTTRQNLTPEGFLYWLGHKERFASHQEQVCAAIMDACLARVTEEGEKELLAALLSGDQTTFELFRVHAPELQHLPDATYDWYSEYYLNRYYPVRFMMKYNGIVFPEWHEKEEAQ